MQNFDDEDSRTNQTGTQSVVKGNVSKVEAEYNPKAAFDAWMYAAYTHITHNRERVNKNETRTAKDRHDLHSSCRPLVGDASQRAFGDLDNDDGTRTNEGHDDAL